MRRTGRLSSRGLRAATIFAAFFSIESCSLAGEERSGLALDLYSKGDYYRAITEYKRAAFQSDDTRAKRWASYRIGESYRRSGRPESGLSYCLGAAMFELDDSLSDSCAISLAKAYMELGYSEAARGVLDSLSARMDSERMLLAGWTYLLEYDFGNARALFLSAGADSLASLSLRGESISERSPVAAGMLSAVIPGSGQIYAGAYKQGLISLVLNGALGYLTYEGFKDRRYFEAAAAAYTGVSRFYVGNILSASRLARERNAKKKMELIEVARVREGSALK